MHSQEKRRRRRRRWIAAILVLLAVLLLCGGRAPLVLGTFNIQTFPHGKTDLEAVAAALAELDADAVAVQEILDAGVFAQVLERASEFTGRRYRAKLVPSCRGRKNGQRLQVGVVYDAARLELVETRPLGSGEICPPGQPPGMVALLREADGRAIAYASVHFTAGGEPERFAERRQQWRWLTERLPGLSAELGAPVIVGGDFNSTGFLGRDGEERRFIDGIVEERGLQLVTEGLPCSMYWETNGRFEPSLLDHVLAPKDMSFGEVAALGMCEALACAPQATMPPEYTAVSDHCPVRAVLRQ
ncbi:MAG TPA: endonuclease/exonuclease/phosphatase family protein [Nannocystis sp.]